VIDARDIKLTMADVLPRLADAAKEQDGSRFLQWKLGSADCSDADREKIFERVLPATAALTKDTFGNFVVQKLLEKGTEDQRNALASEVKGKLMDIANHKYGCRVAQKLVQTLSNDVKVEMVGELGLDVIECIENMHGNHVIQKVIEYMLPEDIDFVIDAVADRAIEMANHMYGCRIIQRLMENCDHDRLAKLLDTLVGSTAKLAKDKHGNYVVQCVLDNGRESDKRSILQTIEGGLLDFAKNKVSSNVVEKCFTISTTGKHADALQTERAALMRTVMGEAGDPKAPLAQLMKDKFGNYTVQCIIENSRGDDWLELKDRITAAEEDLRASQTGKHILAKLEKQKAKMQS